MPSTWFKWEDTSRVIAGNSWFAKLDSVSVFCFFDSGSQAPKSQRFHPYGT